MEKKFIIMSNKILNINNLSFYYKNSNKDKFNTNEWVNIFRDISIDFFEGQIIGIVGKSGCGKTTLGKAIVNYHSLSGAYKKNKDYKIDGNITYYDKNNNDFNLMNEEYRNIKPPPIQMVFQDPRSSLNMKMKVADQLKESIKLKYNLSASELSDKIYEISKDFKIENQLNSVPYNLSGGQRRRFGLAKIISSSPRLIIADEPVASLDVSIKRDIMNILFDLKNQNTTIAVISHDIALLKERADIIYVFDNGNIVEKWNPEIEPSHTETRKLLDDSNYVNEFIESIHE
tara:strand:- start:29 stop:892 length:864 start_codon:yes stop_codon:yes gene_type:complete